MKGGIMRRVLAPAALCGGLLLLGCGGGDAPEAAHAPSAASSSLNSPPVITEVALEPSRPRPGETLRVRVEASDPDGDPIRLDYQWRAGGRELENAAGQPSLHVENL